MTTIVLSPWTDPIIDTLGHDPRAEYVERFWLPALGPTSLLLLRRLATSFEAHPEGLTIEAADLSQALGLGSRSGGASPLFRSLDRLTQFDLACRPTDGHYAVRRRVQPLNLRHLHRLPLHLQREHADWTETQLGTSPLEHARKRARRLAFTLFEHGDDLDLVERTLLSTGFHPTICRESAEWAHAQHQRAFATLDEPDPISVDAEPATPTIADSTADTAA